MTSSARLVRSMSGTQATTRAVLPPWQAYLRSGSLPINEVRPSSRPAQPIRHFGTLVHRLGTDLDHDIVVAERPLITWNWQSDAACRWQLEVTSYDYSRSGRFASKRRYRPSGENDSPASCWFGA